VFSLLLANSNNDGSGYIDFGLLNAVSQIPTKEVLEYEKIASLMTNKNDRSRFYSVMAVEIQRRTDDLDQKFNSKKLFYIDKITFYEKELSLPQYVNKMSGIDLGELSNLNKKIDINTYIESKNNIDILAKIYRKKLMEYRRYLKNYRNYFIALDNLFYCITPIDFKESLYIYNKVVNKLFP
tara:strand:- start:74 stop:619 length:546 start_codon:yes stop_codon:yes gene_type:complete